ncbi:MAG: hypothetical protein UY75_C0011G0005 [Parcubacteria group bacterium GW2011_GWC2_52_8c]|nr:MAG: hypothetical protein UY75_C0011G0005 [Parcubacteria group bacterium GW2011_GWC2_52_8c]
MKENATQKITFSILAVLAMAVVGVLIWFYQPRPETENRDQAAAASSSIVAPESYYDFGQVSMAGGRVSYRYRIKNSGNSAAAIKKIYTSCMCTEAVFEDGKITKGPFGMPGHGLSIPAANVTMEPGSEAEIIVTFDPAAHGPAGVGKIIREIYLEEGAGQPLILRFSANVTP